MKKFLLSLCLTMLSFVGAWAQAPSMEAVPGKDAEGNNDGSVVITLSGNWLGHEDVESGIAAILSLIENSNFTDVTIKGGVTVNQSLISQLVAGKMTANDQGQKQYAGGTIKRLDLSGVYVKSFEGHTGGVPSNDNATFCAQNADVAGTIEYLAMPAFDETVENQTYTIPPYVTSGLSKLYEVILPTNTKVVEHEAFAGVNTEFFKLNPGLEFIGNSAFYCNSRVSAMETVDIPASVKYIGPGAFHFHNFTDIYFHSAQAPICPEGKMFADGDKALGTFITEGNYNGFGGISLAGGNYKTGVASRKTYITQDGYWFIMVHFPASADVPNLDISSYKDETRVYNKVYGNVYGGYGQTPEAIYKESLEIGAPGKEQEYIAKGKYWGFEQSQDYVGKETVVMSYNGLYTALAGQENNTPDGVVGKGVVNSGFEDIYRGLNYIWPSQLQYNRAYVTVANGYNWDGVTKYRPELTQEQYELMAQDGLTVKLNGQEVTVGQDITYDEAMANAYNATLPGAVKEGDTKETYDAAGAIAYNATLDGAKQEGDTYSYTDTEAAAYNAALTGAVKEGDVETVWTEADANTYNATLNGAWHEGDNIYYTAEEAKAYNAALDGAVKAGDSYPAAEPEYYSFEEWKQKNPDLASSFSWMSENDYWNNYVPNLDWNGGSVIKTAGHDAGTYTDETAAAYNATLSGAVSTSTIRIANVTAAQAIEHNATLSGAVKAGDPKTYYTADAAKAYNQTLEGAVKPGDYVTFTAETAAAFNATLPGAVKEGDVKSTYTAQEANDYNATLNGHRDAGYSAKNYADPALEDYLRMDAFQSTRRCVFADNAGGGDEYNTNVPASKAWWTICLPFDMTKDQIDEFFGKGSHVCLFNRVDREIKQLPEKSTLKFYFTDDQYTKASKGDDVVLKAHVPYMIFPTLDGANGTEGEVIKIHMSNFYKKTGNPVPTVIQANESIEGYEGNDHTEYRFIGNYDTKLPVVDADGNVTTTDVVVPQYSYIYAKKQGDTKYQYWFTQNAGIKWAPNKCIIQSTALDRGLTDQNTFFKMVPKEDLPEGEVKQMTILLGDEIDDDANEIDVVIIAGDGEKSEVIYNLNGQMIRTAPQNGVYIKNGKKYIAR